ncbi:MAG: EamA family transporter [Acidimicrobiales bacterium]
MVVFVSLVAAVLFGSGDFCGALATRRATALQVVAGSHLIGLVGVGLLAFALGNPVTGRDLALGAAGGVLGAVGVGLLYRRLAVGPMYLVAPVTAVTAAAVPTLWGWLRGDELSPAAWAGVVLALGAVALVSSVADSGGQGPITAAAVVESLGSGLGFGGFYILMAATDADSQPWPIVGARLTTALGLLAILAVLRRAPLPTDRVGITLIGATGLFEVAANCGYLYASTRGQLAVAAVLVSMYPISTVVLARLVLDERMSRLQIAGVVGAIAAAGLITRG